MHDKNGGLIASNDNWKDKQESAIAAAGIAPGNYTAIVRGKNNTTGVALVEVYRIQ